MSRIGVHDVKFQRINKKVIKTIKNVSIILNFIYRLFFKYTCHLLLQNKFIIPLHKFYVKIVVGIRSRSFCFMFDVILLFSFTAVHTRP